MRITKKWLRDKKDAIQGELRRLAKMDAPEMSAELKKCWPSYENTDCPKTSLQHEMAIVLDLFIDRQLRPAID